MNVSGQKEEEKNWMRMNSTALSSKTRLDISNLMTFLHASTRVLQRISVRIGLHKLIDYSVEILKTHSA